MLGGFGAYSQSEAMRRQAEAQYRLQEHMLREHQRRAQEAAASKSKFDNGDTLDLICVDGVWQEQKAIAKSV